MNFDFQVILNVLMPVLTGLAGWLAGARKRRNDFLSEMQKSIDLLSTENRELLAEMVELRKENALMQVEISALRRENGQLRSEVEELNNRLAGVKTITRTKS